MHVHDYRIQKIQHISIGQIPSFLFFKKRRYICNHCGKKFYENYDFIQKYFRKSNSVFDNVCEDLKSLKNFKTIAKDNDLSIPTVVRYMHFCFLLSNKHNFNLPERIGIDEFKGNCGNDKYQFHIFDLDTKKTIDIVKSRRYDDLEAYFSSFSLEQRCRVKVVSMDLYSPFVNVNIKMNVFSNLIMQKNLHFYIVIFLHSFYIINNMYLDKGLSTIKIADELNGREIEPPAIYLKIPTYMKKFSSNPTGKYVWLRAQIGKILRNEVYLGNVVSRKFQKVSHKIAKIRCTKKRRTHCFRKYAWTNYRYWNLK